MNHEHPWLCWWWTKSCALSSVRGGKTWYSALNYVCSLEHQSKFTMRSNLADSGHFMFSTEKGDVCTSHIGQQVSYLAMWDCEYFACAPALCTSHRAHHPVHALGLLLKIFTGDGPLHARFSQDVNKNHGNHCCSLSDLMSFQTKLELHALAGLFLMSLRCEQSWAEKQGWEQQTSCTPCSLEGRKVTATSQWDHLSCVWKHQKGTGEYWMWQCMETPAITLLSCWRNTATNPGEQHFILVQVKLQMCGTTEGRLNSA